MNHPNKPGTHKVVTRHGQFFVAPLADTTLPEARVSQNARAKLATRVGYVNGSLPGLAEEFCRFLVRRVEGKSPRRSPRRRR